MVQSSSLSIPCRKAIFWSTGPTTSLERGVCVVESDYEDGAWVFCESMLKKLDLRMYLRQTARSAASAFRMIRRCGPRESRS